MTWLGGGAKGYFLSECEVVRRWIFPKELIIGWNYYGSGFLQEDQDSCKEPILKKKPVCTSFKGNTEIMLAC